MNSSKQGDKISNVNLIKSGEWKCMMKRIGDIAVSLFVLVIGAPIFLLLFVLVRRQLGAPAIFVQERPGLHGKPFNLYKFRSMTDARDQSGNLLPDSERLTNFGRFIRKYSLDELPQMVNVLKGDLSLVGPRPLLMAYLPLYTDEQMKRHQVRPGITGWAQVNGRNAITWEEKFELDVWYVHNQTLWLDMKIILLTILKVFQAGDVGQEEDFQGTRVMEREGYR